MNDTLFYILRFIVRNLKWLILGPILVGLIVIFLTRHMTRTYHVETVLYTGVTSGFDLESSGTTTTFFTAQNANDNLIAIAKSRSTLETIAIKLIAQALTYGDPGESNRYITAASYRNFMKTVPQEVADKVDRNSYENTLAMLMGMRNQDQTNFIFETLNWYHPYYSMRALTNIKVNLVGSSDMLMIVYETTDPSICYQTVKLLNEELADKYKELRFSETNDVIAYFERELAKVKAQLKNAEDSLQEFNYEKRIINYEEQTKSIASLFEKTKLREHQLRENLAGLEAAVQESENQMQINKDFIAKNTELLSGLRKVQEYTAGITYAELLNNDSASAQKEISRFSIERDKEEGELRNLASRLLAQQSTKEGAAVSDFVQQWISNMIQREKIKSELDVIEDVNGEVDDLFTFYSPLGANLKRREREIGIIERSYVEILHGLNMARLRQKNLQISSASLRAVTDPVYPLDSKPTKRKILVLLSMVVTFILIIFYLILVEWLDRTIRRVGKLDRFLGRNTVGAIADEKRCSDPKNPGAVLAAEQLFATSRLLERSGTKTKGSVLNVLSLEAGDGKSYFINLLKEDLIKRGYKVSVLEHGKDFSDNSRSYLSASSVEELIPLEKRQEGIDFYIIEHPSILDNGVGTGLISGQAENILLFHVHNTWTEANQQAIAHLEEITGVSFIPFLNGTSQYDLERFVGLLPPYTLLRQLLYKIYNLELSLRPHKKKKNE